jgi:hypothetical protein
MRFDLYSSCYNFHFATWYCYYDLVAVVSTCAINERVVVTDDDGVFLWNDRVID